MPPKPGGMVVDRARRLPRGGRRHDAVPDDPRRDRNRTILDGGFKLAERDPGDRGRRRDRREPDRRATSLLNGFHWTSVFGYRGSYLTAYNNGDYGIYAFDSQYGQFDHSYAGGHARLGLLHRPVLPVSRRDHRLLAENNAMGYSGTNAGGDLCDREHRMARQHGRHRAEHARLRGSSAAARRPDRRELRARQQLADARTRRTCSTRRSASASSSPAGVENLVTQNLVEDHVDLRHRDPAQPRRELLATRDNEVRDNVVRGAAGPTWRSARRRQAATASPATSFSTSLPPAIETLYGCEGPSLRSVRRRRPGADVNTGLRFLDAMDGEFPHGDWRTQPAPPGRNRRWRTR